MLRLEHGAARGDLGELVEGHEDALRYLAANLGAPDAEPPRAVERDELVSKVGPSMIRSGKEAVDLEEERQVALPETLRLRYAGPAAYCHGHDPVSARDWLNCRHPTHRRQSPGHLFGLFLLVARSFGWLWRCMFKDACSSNKLCLLAVAYL